MYQPVGLYTVGESADGKSKIGGPKRLLTLVARPVSVAVCGWVGRLVRVLLGVGVAVVEE